MSAATSGAPWLPDGVVSHLREVTRDGGGGAAAAASDPGAVAADRYELLEVLGEGGMGTVYLARDRRLDREVALKVMRARDEPAVTAAGETEAGSARLRNEACILARLEHPGLVPVHDLGTLPDGRVFYAMKRVRGRGLDAFARERIVDGRADLLRVFERICETVAFAHAHGVIHRDLKPGNIMVGPFGEVLLLDWGLAKLGCPPAATAGGPPSADGAGRGAAATPSDDASTTGPGTVLRTTDSMAPEQSRGAATPSDEVPGTGPGTVLGTPDYMAPEQSRGAAAQADERSDVFALGAILTFLLTGSPVPSATPPEPAAPRVPPPLAAICRRAMALDPERRYPGAAEMAADLARFLDGLPVDAYPETLARRAWRLARRHATPLLLLLTYLLVRVLLLVLARHP